MEVKTPVRKHKKGPRFLLFVYLSLVLHLYILLIIRQVVDPMMLEKLTHLDEALQEQRQENIIIETIINSEKTPEEGLISDRPNINSGPQGEIDYNMLNPNQAPPAQQQTETPQELEKSPEGEVAIEKTQQEPGDPTPNLYDPNEQIDVNMDSEGMVSLATVPRDYAEYFIKMSKEISKNWQHFFPVFQYYQGIIRSGEIVVNYQIDHDGNVSNIKVVKSQGYRGLDKSCVDAIRYSGNFGPLPEGLREKEKINVSFKFVYVRK